MDVLADVFAVSHRLDDIGGEVVRVRRGESDAANARDSIDLSQQPREQWSVGRPGNRYVSPIRIHVLAEKRDLNDTLRRETLHLGDDVAERARTLWPAHQGNDAERARVVAAGGDRDPSSERIPPGSRQGARESLRALT